MCDELDNLVGTMVVVHSATSANRYTHIGILTNPDRNLYVVRDPIRGRVEFGPMQVDSVDATTITLKQWCE